jgi:hypothetical protein
VSAHKTIAPCTEAQISGSVDYRQRVAAAKADKLDGDERTVSSIQKQRATTSVPLPMQRRRRAQCANLAT